MDELDTLIKNVLKDDLNPSEQKIEENFLKLKKNLNSNENNKYYFKRFSYMNLKKVAAISMCSLMCAAAILVGSSSTVRAAALDAIDNIKSIFVVEDSGKIVQRPTSEVADTLYTSSTTIKSDAEVGEIIGYKILFPKSLADSFDLSHRSLGVGLRKKVAYDSQAHLFKQMFKACENQVEFANLSAYSPYRFTVGFYKKNGTNIYIDSSPILDNPINYSEKEDVKIGNIKGTWYKYQSPDYPVIQKGGVAESDRSVEPVFKDTYLLNWENNNIGYSLSTLDESTITKEEAIQIATEFQAAQPK